MVEKKEMVIDGKLYEVVPIDKYVRNPDAYLAGYVAVDADLPYILPIVPGNTSAPGILIRQSSPFSRVRFPSDNANEYSRDNLIDYSKADSYKAFIEQRQMVRSLEKGILSSCDDVFVPPLDEQDTPAMRALKEAIIAKKMDLSNYESRMGANFHNNRRLFYKPRISIDKIIEICNATDIEATLTFRDVSDDVANPMGDEITVVLTSGAE